MLVVVTNEEIIATIRETVDPNIRFKVREALNKWHQDVSFEWLRGKGDLMGTGWRLISTHDLDAAEMNSLIAHIKANIPTEELIWLRQPIL